MQNPNECPMCGGEVEFLAYGKKDAISDAIVEVWWCWNCDLPIEGAPASQEKVDEQIRQREAEKNTPDGRLLAEIAPQPFEDLLLMFKAEKP
jgi:hypothetical protein